MNATSVLRAYLLLNSTHDYSTRPILALLKQSPLKIIQTCQNQVLVEASRRDIEKLIDTNHLEKEADYVTRLKPLILSISIQETM